VTSGPALARVVPLAAAALGCLATTGANAAQSPAACNTGVVVTKQIECFLDAARDAGDAAVCEAAENATVRFQCLSTYAERISDPAPCTRIDTGTTAEETQALRESCVAGVAIARRDPALCKGFTTPALSDSCYMMLVVEAGADPALCDRIQHVVLRRACREPAAGRQ